MVGNPEAVEPGLLGLARDAGELLRELPVPGVVRDADADPHDG
jgi:hypothetical protein